MKRREISEVTKGRDIGITGTREPYSGRIRLNSKPKMIFPTICLTKEVSYLCFLFNFTTRMTIVQFCVTFSAQR